MLLLAFISVMVGLYSSRSRVGVNRDGIGTEKGRLKGEKRRKNLNKWWTYHVKSVL